MRPRPHSRHRSRKDWPKSSVPDLGLRSQWSRSTGIKPHAKGRLIFVTDFGTLRASLFQDGLHEIPVDGAIGIKAAQLPDFHGDPADRIIVATALDDHQLVTSDRKIWEL